MIKGAMPKVIDFYWLFPLLVNINASTFEVNMIIYSEDISFNDNVTTTLLNFTAQ